MSLSRSARSALGWLRAGQCAGYPYSDCASAVLVLGRDHLSDGEVSLIADTARARGALDATDAAVEITRVLDALPAPDDVARVLAAYAA